MKNKIAYRGEPEWRMDGFSPLQLLRDAFPKRRGAGLDFVLGILGIVFGRR